MSEEPNLRILYCAAFCLLLTTPAKSAEIHSNHWVFSMPSGTPASNDLIIRNSYAMSTNDSTKFADWVAYRLTPREVFRGPDLERKWRADPWLEDEETLEPKPHDDYKDASKEPLEYDRGHLAPLASFKGSVDASEVNYYSNITPQSANLNRGPWVKLETKVREYVLKGNTVWVTTGPLYEGTLEKLPNENEVGDVNIPSGFWKIVFDGQQIAAFIMHQNSARSDGIAGKVVTVADIEERSGLAFDHGPDEAALESSTAATWLLE